MKTSVKMRFQVTVVGLFVCVSGLIQAQLANANYGLKGRMGIAVSHEITNGSNDFLEIDQQHTNIQISLPIYLQIDSLPDDRRKVHLLKADYTLRYTQTEVATDLLGYTPVPSELWTNALELRYIHTLSDPWLMSHSIQGILTGLDNDFMPLYLNLSSVLLYKVNDNLIVGGGLLYLHLGDIDRKFVFIPVVDWRINDKWFVNMTLPKRLLLGKDIGREKQTTIALASFLDFFSRYTYRIVEDTIYESFEWTVGVDIRHQIRGKLFVNGFVGNNFHKEVRINDDSFDTQLEEIMNSGLNVRLGLSLNLQ